MGANTSVLSACGETTRHVQSINFAGRSRSGQRREDHVERFELVDGQLAAVVAPPATYEILVKCSLDKLSALRCTATCVSSPSAVADIIPVSPSPARHSNNNSDTPDLEEPLLAVHVTIPELPGGRLYVLSLYLGSQRIVSARVLLADVVTRERESSFETPTSTISDAVTDTELDFPADGPHFRTQIARWDAAVPQLRATVKTVGEKASKLAGSLAASYRDAEGLAAALHDLQSLGSAVPYMHEPISTLIKLLTKLGKFQNSVSSAVSGSLQQSSASCLTALDLRMTSTRKKQYQDKTKEFYTYVGKNFSSSDAANFARKKQFELGRFDYFTYFVELLNGSSLRQLNVELCRFADLLAGRVDPSSSLTTAHLLREASRVRDDYGNYKKTIVAKRTNILRAKNYNDLSKEMAMSSNSDYRVYREGILWTQKGHGKSSSWHKQWVVLRDSQLAEYSDWKSDGKKLARPILNLTFSCIKGSHDKNNGFEIVTVDGSSRAFRAESDNEAESWIRDLLISIGIDPQNSSKTRTTSSSLLDAVRSLDDSNKICCDCGSEVQVDWISINLLCVVCINCSAVHRSLGTHVSKIRSLKLDFFDSKEMSELLKRVSNKNVNQIYEAELAAKPINSSATIEERTPFILNKYAKRAFVLQLQEPDKRSLQKRLYHDLIKSIHLNSIYSLQQCIAQGVDFEEINQQHGDSIFPYSLKHFQGTRDKPVFFITEFLLLNGLMVGKIPGDKSGLSQPELAYWKGKAETNSVHPLKSVSGSVSMANRKLPSIAKLNTSLVDTGPLREPPATSSAAIHGSKRWSINTSMPTSPPSAVSSSSSFFPKNLKFPKLPAGKSL
ncbi:LAMI_0F00782g1_1 [Lachancea mirantina]|uniref:ADP-ribosylation factor GTPase-activating protein n=1 Tax=Lachancea mirantina TaxID=1230905 RepID=A0A1G4JVS6_9SACH|nr:LAMI_0F00782g1_1 [Lachancea mirantina]